VQLGSVLGSNGEGVVLDGPVVVDWEEVVVVEAAAPETPTQTA
jgi:hypothetical protein